MCVGAVMRTGSSHGTGGCKGEHRGAALLQGCHFQAAAVAAAEVAPQKLPGQILGSGS